MISWDCSSTDSDFSSFADWLECSMAERTPPDLSDGMMPDEMLSELQTEMVRISTKSPQ